jgi:hypothetical protein
MSVQLAFAAGWSLALSSADGHCRRGPRVEATQQSQRHTGREGKFAAFHSIASLARSRSRGGISIPSAFAVLRLMTNSKVVGCTTGKSAAAQTRTTVDPTVGVGLRATFNNQSVGGIALPPITIGANAELSFRPGSVVQAQSPNFPSESYYGTVDPRPIANFMFRVGIPFGGTR